MPGAPRRLLSVLGLLSVAVPAAVAAHCAGYELAAAAQRWLGPLGGGDVHAHHGPGAHDAPLAAHAGHLPLLPLTSAALLVGAVVVLAVLVGSRRLAGFRPPRLGSLFGAQLVVLVAIEAAGAVSDLSPPLSSVAFAVGLQLPVAVVLVQLARGTRRLVARLLGGSPVPDRERPVLGLPPTVVAVPHLTLWSLRPPGRAPPGGPNPIAPAALAFAI